MGLFSFLRRRSRTWRLELEPAVSASLAAGGDAASGQRPADVARELARTLAIKGVPIDTLMRDFPHVVSRIAYAWNDPARLKSVIEDLVIDRRGGRRGFPPDALAELIALQRFCEPFFPKSKPNPWDDVKLR